MKEEFHKKGRLLFTDENCLYLAEGYKLYESNDDGYTWSILYDFNIYQFHNLLKRSSLFHRLFRKGIHHLVIDESIMVAIVDNYSYYSFQKSEFIKIGKINGSRPLNLCVDNNAFYYGEYRKNEERSIVSVWKWQPGQLGWNPCWQFNNIRHIHGVFSDPYTNSIWVTTGDDDFECAIWQTTDNFRSIKKVIGGNQQCRAVQLLFAKEFVYFGSDTPLEKNFIYRLNRKNCSVEKLTDVSSSVFFGTSVAGNLFFSTVVEPSNVNLTNYCEVWRSENGYDWNLFSTFRKDLFPLKYFQYGQVKFPLGNRCQTSLWISPFATEYHGRSLKYKL